MPLRGVQTHAPACAIRPRAVTPRPRVPAVRRKGVPPLARATGVGAVAPNVVGPADPRKPAPSGVPLGLLALLGRVPTATTMAAAPRLPNAEDVAPVPDEVTPGPGPRAVPRGRATRNAARRAAPVAIGRRPAILQVAAHVATFHGAITRTEAVLPKHAAARSSSRMNAPPAPVRRPTPGPIGVVLEAPPAPA